MNVHKNARLTHQVECFWLNGIESGWPVGRAAMASGVSERTAHRWLGRYRGGDCQLLDPQFSPSTLSFAPGHERLARIEVLRRQRMTSPMIARRWASLRWVSTGWSGSSPSHR